MLRGVAWGLSILTVVSVLHHALTSKAVGDAQSCLIIPSNRFTPLLDSNLCHMLG